MSGVDLHTGRGWGWGSHLEIFLMYTSNPDEPAVTMALFNREYILELYVLRFYVLDSIFRGSISVFSSFVLR